MAAHVRKIAFSRDSRLHKKEMRDAANQRTKHYKNAPTPKRRDLLRLYDLMTDGSSPTTLRINDHVLESRAELETYPLESISKLHFAVTWGTPRGEAFAGVLYDPGSAVCDIWDDLHPPSLAFLALADEMFGVNDGQVSRELLPPLGNPTQFTTAASARPTTSTATAGAGGGGPPSRTFFQRAWDEVPKYVVWTFFALVLIVLTSLFGLK